MFDALLKAEATALIDAFRRRGLTLATAESCTGGLVAALLTEIPGSSAVLDRGFVTYSNDAKVEMLAVPAALIAEHGVVSRAVACAMAEGAIVRSGADIAIAVTGVAGPGGGSAEKPVGLVHIAAARKGEPCQHRECRFDDLGRSTVRLAAVAEALALARRMADRA